MQWLVKIVSMQMEQVISNLNFLREMINIFHHINETKPFYWTDLFPGMGTNLNGLWRNVLWLVLFGLFTLMLICVLSLSAHLSLLCFQPFLSLCSLQLLMYEIFREISEVGTIGAQDRPPQYIPQWHINYFKLKLLGVRRAPWM